MTFFSVTAGRGEFGDFIMRYGRGSGANPAQSILAWRKFDERENEGPRTLGLTLETPAVP